MIRQTQNKSFLQDATIFHSKLETLRGKPKCRFFNYDLSAVAILTNFFADVTDMHKRKYDLIIVSVLVFSFGYNLTGLIAPKRLK